MTELKLLTSGALHMVDEDFRLGKFEERRDELSMYVDHPDFTLEIDELLDEIDRILDEAGNGRLSNSEKKKMDKELAKALHQELDITRRQASNPEIWNYLSIYEMPQYVLKRWGDDAAKVRWIVRAQRKKSLNRHAFAYLWWVAEKTYSPDRGYDFTRKLIEDQDLKNYLFGNSYGTSSTVSNAIIAELHDMRMEDSRDILHEFQSLTSTFSVDSMSQEEARGLVRDLKDEDGKEEKSSLRNTISNIFR